MGYKAVRVTSLTPPTNRFVLGPPVIDNSLFFPFSFLFLSFTLTAQHLFQQTELPLMLNLNRRARFLAPKGHTRFVTVRIHRNLKGVKGA